MAPVSEGSVTTVSSLEARRLSPSLLLQTDLIDRFIKRSNEGRVVSLLQAPPHCGKTSFLKQTFRALENLGKNVLWIDVRSEKVSQSDFAKLLSQILGLRSKSPGYSDLADYLESNDLILLIDNLDRVDELPRFYQALKDRSSGLRVIASVSRIPKIPTDLAFEVSCWSYAGLSKSEVGQLIQKHFPDKLSVIDDLWKASRGNSYLLRLLLQSDCNEGSLIEYWKALLPTLSEDLLGALQQTSLCESRWPDSESFFLSQIEKSDLTFLEQTAIVDAIDPSLLTGYRLNSAAKTWLQSLMVDSTCRAHLREKMLRALSVESQLSLREEYCWQLQRLNRQSEAIAELKTLLPLLYQNFRFQTGARISQDLWLNLSVETWNWRRLCLLEPETSLAELRSIQRSFSLETPDEVRADWTANELWIVSRLNRWQEFESILTRNNELLMRFTRPRCLVEACLSSRKRILESDLPEAARLAKSAFETCISEGLDDRTTLSCLSELLSAFLDLGDDEESRRCAKLYQELLRTRKLKSDGTNFVNQITSLYNRLGHFPQTLQHIMVLNQVSPVELNAFTAFQFSAIKSQALFLQGKALQADQIFQKEKGDLLKGEISEFIFSCYWRSLPFRLSVGAVVEVLDVLQAMSRSKRLSNDYLLLVRAFREWLQAIANGESTSQLNVPQLALDLDYLEFLTPLLEYQWVDHRILNIDPRIEERLLKIPEKRFPSEFMKIQSYRMIFDVARGKEVDDSQLKALYDDFLSQEIHHFAFRMAIGRILNAVGTHQIDRARELLAETKSRFAFVESPEDKAWLLLTEALLLKALGQQPQALNHFQLIDPLSGAAKSSWYRLLVSKTSEIQPTQLSQSGPKASDRWTLDMRVLRLLDSKGAVQVQDKPVLIKLLHSLLVAFPGALDKESMTKLVWAETYNPLVHDTRVYTSVRRLREILNHLFELKESVTAVNGMYSVSRILQEKIEITES
jgi:hypothetical protein